MGILTKNADIRCNRRVFVCAGCDKKGRPCTTTPQLYTNPPPRDPFKCNLFPLAIFPRTTCCLDVETMGCRHSHIIVSVLAPRRFALTETAMREHVGHVEDTEGQVWTVRVIDALFSEPPQGLHKDTPHDNDNVNRRSSMCTQRHVPPQ